MNLYVCVYRQPIPKSRDNNRANKSASGDDALKDYLRRYKNRFRRNKRNIGHFYDWGDDPAFFAAEHFLDNVHGATWGVCRPDVRRRLSDRGDVVVFFCVQQQKDEVTWKYYYIGLGTVGEVICDRRRLWRKREYVKYTKFYNLLLDSEGRHNEMISYHSDWKKISMSPYVIFDKDTDKTHFNVINPLHVATYVEGTEPWKGEILERWRLSNELVKRIYDLVPRRRGKKKLRTSGTGFAHRHINVRDSLKRQERGLSNEQLDEKLVELRRSFLNVSKEIAEEL